MNPATHLPLPPNSLVPPAPEPVVPTPAEAPEVETIPGDDVIPDADDTHKP